MYFALRSPIEKDFIQGSQVKKSFKNTILKRHYSQEKKSIFSDELINSCCNKKVEKSTN